MLWFEKCPACPKTFHAEQRFDAEHALREHECEGTDRENGSAR